ncbi:hypothetical protein E3A20_12230 [Planctomyces bekefii]|uniref:Uncharacterized protein n=1 Tax=Planctomyces bekefii TaxID=1653850 RepID=A0A5C6M6M4_9PLAN|nr:hypothetical protein E3A20_12230 [Planctomyces bekefii]
MDELSARNAESSNQDELLQAPQGLGSLVSQDLQTFHFCFFQIVNKLDERLAIGGPLMSEVASIYFETMKGLWILARSLDQVTGSNRYFSYLRVRYVQISKEIFGRDIEVVAPPLSERPSSPGTAGKKGHAKPSGKAQSSFED